MIEVGIGRGEAEGRLEEGEASSLRELLLLSIAPSKLPARYQAHVDHRTRQVTCAARDARDLLDS